MRLLELCVSYHNPMLSRACTQENTASPAKLTKKRLASSQALFSHFGCLFNLLFLNGTFCRTHGTEFPLFVDDLLFLKTVDIFAVDSTCC